MGNGYNLVSLNSGKCMDIYADLSADGTLITQYECLGASQKSQIWQLVANGNYYQLQSSLTGKCLDLTAGNVTEGTNFQE
jgi:endoglucanase